VVDVNTLPRTSLYEQLADEIARQVRMGIFRPGDRLPSVRQISSQRELSITTVLQAYHLLEDRGIIEARPQSGYYVRCQTHRSTPDPEISTPSPDPAQVTVHDLAMMVLRDASNPQLVQFGAAIPDPDLLPTKRLNQILANLARRDDLPQNYFGLPEGHEDLRIQVAQRAVSAGCTLSPDEIVITSGAMEAISLSLRAVCKPGDLVAIESPTYFGVLQTLEVQGLQVLEIPTHHQTGMSLEALRFALDNHPIRAVMAVTNFNNPLGSCMPDEHKQELAALLAGREIPLIEDDINGDLYFNGARPSVVKAYDDQGLVLLCSSFSKDLSPSYRVGWVAPGRFKNQVLRLKMATNIGTAMLPQLAIARFLSSGHYDHHLRKIRRAYAQKVTAMSQAVLEAFPEGTRVTSPLGGFVLWVQMPEQVDSLVLYKMALKAGITLVPGYIFSPNDRYRNFIRLNAAYWSPKNERALLRLGGLVARLAETA